MKPEIQCLQWLMQGSVEPGGGFYVFAGAGQNSMNWPMTIPNGWYFGLTDVHFQSKFTDGPAPVALGASNMGSRASLACIDAVITVPDNAGKVTFKVPFVLQPGFVLAGTFINNDSEIQNMTINICGLLVHNADPSVTTGPNAFKQPYEAFSFLFSDYIA